MLQNTPCHKFICMIHFFQILWSDASDTVTFTNLKFPKIFNYYVKEFYIFIQYYKTRKKYFLIQTELLCSMFTRHESFQSNGRIEWVKFYNLQLLLYNFILSLYTYFAFYVFNIMLCCFQFFFSYWLYPCHSFSIKFLVLYLLEPAYALLFLLRYILFRYCKFNGLKTHLKNEIQDNIK